MDITIINTSFDSENIPDEITLGYILKGIGEQNKKYVLQNGDTLNIIDCEYEEIDALREGWLNMEVEAGYLLFVEINSYLTANSLENLPATAIPGD